MSTFVHTNSFRSLHMVQGSRKFLAVTAQIVHRRQPKQYIGENRARQPTSTCALVCLMISVSYPRVCMGTSGGPRTARAEHLFFRGRTSVGLGPLVVGTQTTTLART